MAARLVDQLGDFGLRHPIVFGKLLVRARFFHRIEVFALEVLDQRQRHHLALIEIAHQRRNFVQPGALGGAPPALTRNQPIAPLAQRRDDDRLNHTTRGDRGSQRIEAFLVEMRTRLTGQRLDIRNGNRGKAVRRRFRRRCGRLRLPIILVLAAIRAHQRLFAAGFAQQRAKPLAELLLAIDLPRAGACGRFAHAAFLFCGRRPINSRASPIYARLPEQLWS